MTFNKSSSLWISSITILGIVALFAEGLWLIYGVAEKNLVTEENLHQHTRHINQANAIKQEIQQIYTMEVFLHQAVLFEKDILVSSEKEEIFAIHKEHGKRLMKLDYLISKLPTEIKLSIAPLYENWKQKTRKVLSFADQEKKLYFARKISDGSANTYFKKLQQRLFDHRNTLSINLVSHQKTIVSTTKKMSTETKDMVNQSSTALMVFALLGLVTIAIISRNLYRHIQSITSLQTANNTLKDQNEKIEAMLTSIKIAQSKTVKAKEEAIQASQAKSLFLSRMSHELRTPLNAVIGFSRLIINRADPLTPKKYSEVPAVINKAGHHLLGLVNDILDIVQIEQGKLSFSLKPCHLGSIVQNSLRLCQSHLDKHDVDVIVENVEVVVLADPLRLEQAITNLLSNAIKYNQKRGKVTINFTHIDEHTLEVNIIDTGVGINKDDTTRLFEPFTRLSYAESHQIEGTGIGLSLTKYLIEEMGGNIYCESTEGQGSRFYFSIEKSVSLANNASTSKAIKLALNSDLEKSILYVEDDINSQRLLTATLDPHPHISLSIFNTAEEGLLFAKAHTPDLILMDINLPEMDGMAAFKFLRDVPALAQTPIIALSADSLASQIEIAIEVGFDGYFTKPIDIEQFAQFILSPESYVLSQ
ncbi:hypothetical protein A9Q99_11500 [Gammaproteobacteria bacterium 45_16_T64]|nr:hypothetical protein A9Q99_11500 [Gammaproteobacteria bacterium 45_16_T64]